MLKDCCWGIMLGNELGNWLECMWDLMNLALSLVVHKLLVLSPEILLALQLLALLELALMLDSVL